MSEEHSRISDDPKAKKHNVDYSPYAERDSSFTSLSSESLLPSLLPNLDQLHGRGSAPVRATAMHEMQRTYGNRAVQRYLQDSITPSGDLLPNRTPTTKSGRSNSSRHSALSAQHSALNVQRTVSVQRFEIGFLPGADYIHQTLTAESLKKAGLLGQGGTYESEQAQDFARGTIWNDDPRMQLMQPNEFKRDWGGNIDYGHDFMNFEGEANKKLAAGEKGFGPGDNMLARTHFGDMQFLHGMATKDKETAAETQEKMLKWAQFSTMVAQGKLSGDTKFADLAKTKGMEDIAALFPDMKDQDVNSLFGVTEESKEGAVKERAMGSLLHMVQDSYAGGHVKRNDKGEVESFHSYTGQDHSKHGHSDALGEGETEADKLAATPGATQAIDQGAAVLKMVMGDKDNNGKQADWAEIEKKLKGDVFKLSDPNAQAGAGADYEKHDKGLIDSIKDEGLGGAKEWAGDKWNTAYGGFKKGAIEAAYHTKEAGKWVGNKASEAWDWTKEKAGNAWDATKQAGSWLGDQASKGWNWAKDTAGDAWDATKQGASDAWDATKQAGNWVGDQASQAWDATKQAGSWASDKASQGWEATQQGASNAWNAAGDAVNATGDAISSGANTVWEETQDVGRAIGGGAEDAYDWLTTW